MKNLKKAVVTATLKLAKKGVKNDLNSTGSCWMYQPKMPQITSDTKNMKK